VILLTGRSKAHGADTSEGHVHGGRTRCPIGPRARLAFSESEVQRLSKTEQKVGSHGLMDAAWEAAIKRGDLQIVLELLGRGTDVDARDRYGETALMLAAHAGHLKIVETLVAHRANLNITAKFGLSALMLAILAGQAEVASLLAKAGANLALRGTGAPGFADKTAYDLAVERGMLELSTTLKPKP
jgi:ankyrin repeat protein